MNHDYAHCLDYTKDCPKDCFRAELQRDIEQNRSEFIGVPLTYSHFRDTEECKLVKDKKMDDTISRKAAIEAVDIGNLHLGIVDALQNIISELPSAVKHGHWVWKKPSDDCRCSNCGKIADQKYPYCPWCGARMAEGEEDEQRRSD